MARSKRGALLLAAAGAAAGALALPAAGQKSPQSILPPGFGEAPPPAAPAAPAAPVASSPDTLPAPAIALPPPSPAEVAAGNQALADADSAAAEAAAEALRRQDVPDASRRPLDHIGLFSPEQTGIAADGFGGTDGRFLATLMARLDAPIASRWLSMLLRRTLTTDVATPAAVDPADWTAERALLLVRMGEADAARLLVQQVDSDHVTPRLRAAALQAAVAAADPGALCPLADAADAANAGSWWTLGRAMCAGMRGDNGAALSFLARARGVPHGPRGVDLALAQRVIGAGSDARRAPQIEWSQVGTLTPWRFGLASALGIAVPDALLEGGGLAMQAWRARAPMLPIATRLGAERVAATLGVVSAADLVDAYAAAAADGDPNAMDDTPAGRLRTAYAARDEDDRLGALRALWADPANERDAYASYILAARAAARIGTDADLAKDAPDLIRAMLSAGLDLQAARWTGVARGLRGTAGEEARALLAVGGPVASVGYPVADLPDFGSGGRGAARLRAQDLFAGLAGLGRLDPAAVGQLAGQLGVPVAAVNPWTRAIDGAAARGEPATVVLLAAVGMQTADWTQVQPAFLFHIVAALHRVGLDPEARMIAAEALTRT